MAASAAAAIAALEVPFFGKTFVAFGRVIKILAFFWAILATFVLHRAKLMIRAHVSIGFKVFGAERL